MTSHIGTLLLSAITASSPPPLQGTTGGGGSMTAFLFQMTIIMVLGFFLFIRPQQKARKAHEERVKQLKRGDEIMTSGGLIGEVVHISQSVKDGTPAPSLEDRITIKSGESRVVIERGRINKVFAPNTPVVDENKK